MNFEEFRPRRILDVFHLKGDENMVLDVGDGKNRVKGGF